MNSDHNEPQKGITETLVALAEYFREHPRIATTTLLTLTPTIGAIHEIIYYQLLGINILNFVHPAEFMFLWMADIFSLTMVATYIMAAIALWAGLATGRPSQTDAADELIRSRRMLSRSGGILAIFAVIGLTATIAVDLSGLMAEWKNLYLFCSFLLVIPIISWMFYCVGRYSALSGTPSEKNARFARSTLLILPIILILASPILGAIASSIRIQLESATTHSINFSVTNTESEWAHRVVILGQTTSYIFYRKQGGKQYVAIPTTRLVQLMSDTNTGDNRDDSELGEFEHRRTSSTIKDRVSQQADR